MKRELVFPWYKKIVEVIHNSGRPTILHSCGCLFDVMDDMKFDGKHSYEDGIMPVEEFYDLYHDRVAIMGGVDLDFICTKTPAEIVERCDALNKKTAKCGGFAMGTGNSVPEYVPQENYFAMTSSVIER